MSIAFFGIVRSKPREAERLGAKERRVADRNQMWARQFEQLGRAIEKAESGD